MTRIPTHFLGIACLLLPALADAQPGATPPGSVPPYAPAPAPSPYPEPAPAPYPQPAPAPYPEPAPAPYPQPAPAPNYAPNYAPNQQPLPPAQKKRGRHGWNFGFSGAVGSMDSSVGRLDCQTCVDSPPGIGGEIHVGTMVTPKLALQAEGWLMNQALGADNDTSISQTFLMITGQYWLSSRLWIKAGFGFSSLSYNYPEGDSQNLGDGTALMGALGYEILRSGRFALDLQLKAGVGLYSDPDEEVQVNVLALGFNWY